MCLITTQKRPKTAKEDFIVYKALNKNLTSPYSSFQYERGKEYATEIKESEDWTCYDPIDNYWLDNSFGTDWNVSPLTYNLKSLGRGFHSALKQDRIDEEGCCLFECVVPAGSKYYINGTGLCVSDKIIIKRKLRK